MTIDHARGDRLRCVVQCQYCGWAASMTGDDPDDVDLFLTKALQTHVVEVHGAEGRRDDRTVE